MASPRTATVLADAGCRLEPSQLELWQRPEWDGEIPVPYNTIPY